MRPFAREPGTKIDDSREPRLAFRKRSGDFAPGSWPARWPTILSACALASVSSPTETTMASVLTSADNGKTIDLRVGAAAALRLAENPSTGYRWAH